MELLAEIDVSLSVATLGLSVACVCLVWLICQGGLSDRVDAQDGVFDTHSDRMDKIDARLLEITGDGGLLRAEAVFRRNLATEIGKKLTALDNGMLDTRRVLDDDRLKVSDLANRHGEFRTSLDAHEASMAALATIQEQQAEAIGAVSLAAEGINTELAAIKPKASTTARVSGRTVKQAGTSNKRKGTR